MRVSTSIALGTFVILGSIAQNVRATTHQDGLLLTPQSRPNLQAQVMMKKPAEDNQNDRSPANNPPANNPPANNPPPKQDPPHPGFGLNPLPIDRPGFPAGGTPDLAPGLPPGFRPSSVTFTNYYHDRGSWTTSPTSKTRKVCAKGYRIVQGSLCQRLKTQAVKK
jgi:hypothetical protein